MHSRLLLAIGSAAWLIAANLACAEELGTDTEMATDGTQTDVSSGDNDAIPADVGNGVEYRRKDRSGENFRTGRSDRSADRPGGASDSSGGGEGGDGGEGGGGDGGAGD
jgi:hypothetical protein